MSDHADGDAPALARDAAGVRLTDAEAVALAAEVLSDDGLCDAVPTLAAIARYVLAVAPVVAAARRQTAEWDDWIAATDATEAAVRALDGAE